ncbi:hypothetical protein BDV40DRAFT_107588 [Aspergillus tamarii]|uniref:Uncharacterized protein n=1 Tax=Aspergillus tamarii TaxID=41984 RepID=A0A5N6V466_ASPTM|nr:hypothetical protein BDV40DRAFT_107588 [Aspergillus tamarii]
MLSLSFPFRLERCCPGNSILTSPNGVDAPYIRPNPSSRGIALRSTTFVSPNDTLHTFVRCQGFFFRDLETLYTRSHLVIAWVPTLATYLAQPCSYSLSGTNKRYGDPAKPISSCIRPVEYWIFIDDPGHDKLPVRFQMTTKMASKVSLVSRN